MTRGSELEAGAGPPSESHSKPAAGLPVRGPAPRRLSGWSRYRAEDRDRVRTSRISFLAAAGLAAATAVGTGTVPKPGNRPGGPGIQVHRDSHPGPAGAHCQCRGQLSRRAGRSAESARRRTPRQQSESNLKELRPARGPVRSQPAPGPQPRAIWTRNNRDPHGQLELLGFGYKYYDGIHLVFALSKVYGQLVGIGISQVQSFHPMM